MKKNLFIILVFFAVTSNINADIFERKEQACNAGKGMECLFVASWYMSGKDVKQDSSKAVEFFWKACEAGAAIGCYNLGNMYARGEGVVKMHEKAKEFFKRACDGGIENGCHNYKVLNKNISFTN